MGKNVAVFVDVANVFYAAKAAGVDIDYVTLLRSASAGRDLVRAYAYTGLDPDNENQRNFHSFLARHGYRVVSKDIRKYGDGKVKANLDIELVIDMMKTARNLDIAIVVSGDGDFAPAIRAVQEMGVRVEVISFRGNTSSDLIDVADQFTDITALAKVDKGSSRSGRRVAGDEDDLSMTQVPEKQTEGSGRGRGRARGRGRTAEPEPLAVATSGQPEARTRSRARAGGLVALPGERLAKAAEPAPEEPVEEEPAVDMTATEATEATEAPDESTLATEEGRRRRRRRGGRGRGRGRGRADEQPGEEHPASEAIAAGDERDEEAILAPAPVRPTAFGSIWDSQIGVPSGPVSSLPVDEEELDEPEIPEYLLAERRQGRNRGRGAPVGRGRGGRPSSYASAVDRERYGRGGGVNRYPEAPRVQGPARPGEGGRRFDRPAGGQPRPERAERQPARSSEPWSEVPPEIEELLRAQLAGKLGRPAGDAAPSRPGREVRGGARDARSGGPRRTVGTDQATAATSDATGAAPPSPVVQPTAADVAASAAPRSRRGRTPKATPLAPATLVTETAVPGARELPVSGAPKRRAPRARTATAGAPREVAPPPTPVTPAARPRRSRAGSAAPGAGSPATEPGSGVPTSGTGTGAGAPAASPRRRAARASTAAQAQPKAGSSGDGVTSGTEAPSPKRRPARARTPKAGT